MTKSKIGNGRGDPNLDRSKTGRAKGTPNKVTADVKAMILGALDDAGGRAYLARQAEENPGPFMTLVGKCLPKDMTLTGGDGSPLVVQIVRFGDDANNTVT